MAKAFFVLDDGRIFEGNSWGAIGRTYGEAVFSTGMTGYQETLTDPSYHKQVVIMTSPHIGNTGVNFEDNESSQIWVAGFVVRNPSAIVSNWRANDDLESALAIANMVLVETGLLTWRGIAEKLSINPSAIAGYGDHGSDLSVGRAANITIIDPKREWRVDRDLMQSRSKNTPYHGMQMRGVARDVIYRGSVVLRNGEVHNG